MLRLTVVAHPYARLERVDVTDETIVHVWVRQRPIEGQANAAIERVLAQAVGLRPPQVRLVSGASTRRKIVEVDVPDRAALHQRFTAYGLLAD
jgi:uncharacterized protein YggU (UPF0235/DUF167 family)